jgi:SAM-dependent methyltransferase
VSTGPEVLVAQDHEEAFALLTTYLSEVLPEGRPLTVVEAGCGKHWAIGDVGRPMHLLGVDLDEEALNLRIHHQGDLDEAVHGDLMEVDLPPAAHDLVFSAFVLEHLPDPDGALRRFVEWLRPGGLAVVVIPDRDTSKGWVTRVTPFWAHVMYYRWVKGRKTAGKPGYEPYPTHYGEVVGERGLAQFCEDHDVSCRLRIEVEVNVRSDGRLTVAANRIIGALSFGRLRSDHCDAIYVLERTA